MFGEFRHKESSPADFFTQDRGKILDDCNGCREKEIERDSCTVRERAKSEVLGDEIHERLVVEPTEPGSPDKTIYKAGVSQRDQVARYVMTRLAPSPGKAGHAPAQVFAGEQRSHGRAPHEAARLVHPL